MQPCPKCNSTEVKLIVYLAPRSWPNVQGVLRETLPAYAPMLKGICGNCKRYRQFEKQTPELIEKINKALEKNPIPL